MRRLISQESRACRLRHFRPVRPVHSVRPVRPVRHLCYLGYLGLMGLMGRTGLLAIAFEPAITRRTRPREHRLQSCAIASLEQGLQGSQLPLIAL